MKPHLPHFIRGTKKNPEKNGVRSGVDSQRAVLAIATVVILSFLLSMPMLPSRVSLKLGDISPDNITARKTVSYKDTIETDMRRERAADSVGKVYDPVPNAADQAIDSLKTIFHTVADVKRTYPRAGGALKVARIRERLGSILSARISDETFATLLKADPDTLREIEDNSLRIVSGAMGKEIREDAANIRAAREALSAEAVKLLKNPQTAAAVSEISQASLRPNRIFNDVRTASLQEKAREDTRPVLKQINSGDLIIAKGEVVSQEHIQKFEALGLRHPKLDYRSVLSLTLLVIMAVWIVAAYLMRYHNEVYSNTKALLLLS
ncbi:MAG: hypothetical protein M1133_08450, partial [Armatimonadetes bacterium]|nr:hypothetical protein [Armatimonadota bacterium]